MAKIRSRMDYAREMQDEIQGVVSYAFDRLQSLHDVQLKLHQMGDEVWFGDTLEEHRLKAKFKDKEEKVTDLYKELDSYTKQKRYADVYRAFMVELKDEDDEGEWGSIFNKYREQILDFKIKMNRTHQDFLSEMSQVFRIVADQKRKEKEHKMMKDTPIEEFVKNEEKIRKVLYEKCSAGEITLEEREAALAKLSSYNEAASRFTTEVLNAVEEFCEGTLTCEELDTILTGYYKENPEQALYFNGTHIDNRYNAMKNEIVGLYEAGAMDLDLAAEHVDYLSNIYDIAIAEHVDCLTEAVDHPMIDLMVSGMDDYFGAVQNFKESAEEGASDLETRLAALDHFAESTWQYFEATGNVVEEEVKESVKSAVDSYTAARTIANGTVIAAYLACIGLILSIPIGKAINMKKGSNVIKAYEDIHPDAVKYKDLDIVKMSASGAGAKYIPEVQKMLSTDMRVTGKCYLAKYKRKPFAVIVRLQQKTSSVSTGDNGYTVQSSDYRFYYKSLCPEAEKDEDFYEAALMLKKFKVCTPEIKSFAKDLKKEYEELKKEAAEEEKKKEQEEKLAKTVKEAAIARESAGIVYDNDQIYRDVRKQLMDKYTAGEITLEMREAALMEARDRLFGDDVENMMEGVLGGLFKKKADAAAGMRKLSNDVSNTNAKVKALSLQYKSNQQKINKLMDQIQDLQVKAGAADGASNREKIMDQVKKLRAEVMKLNDLNRGIQQQIVKANYATESVDVENLTQEELDTKTEGVLGGLFKKKEAQANATGSDTLDKLVAMYRDNRYKIDQAADKIKELQKQMQSMENGRAGKAYDSAATEVKRLRAEVKKLSDANTKIQKQIAKARAVATNESVNVEEMTQEDLDLMMESIFSDIAKKAENMKPKPSAQQAQAKINANEAEIKRLKLMLNDIMCMKRRKDIDPTTMKQLLDKEKKIDKKLDKLRKENQKLSPLSRVDGVITEPY